MMYTHIQITDKSDGLHLILPLSIGATIVTEDKDGSARFGQVSQVEPFGYSPSYAAIRDTMIGAGLVLDCTGSLVLHKPTMTGFDPPEAIEAVPDWNAAEFQDLIDQMMMIKAHLLPLATFDERFARERVADVVGELVNLWQRQREIIKQSQLDFKDQRRALDVMNKQALESAAELARLDRDIKTALEERTKVEGELRDCRAEIEDLRHENEALALKLRNAEGRAMDAERRLSIIKGTYSQSGAGLSGPREPLQPITPITRAAPLTIQQARGMLAQHQQPCACEQCDAARGAISHGDS